MDEIKAQIEAQLQKRKDSLVYVPGSEKFELSDEEWDLFRDYVDTETYLLCSDLNGNAKAVLEGISMAKDLLKDDPFHAVAKRYVQLFAKWRQLELPAEVKRTLAIEESGEEEAARQVKEGELLPYAAKEKDFCVEYSYVLGGIRYDQIVVTKCRDDAEATWTVRKYVDETLAGKTEYRECEIVDISTDIPRYTVKRIPSLYYQQIEDEKTNREKR